MATEMMAVMVLTLFLPEGLYRATVVKAATNSGPPPLGGAREHSQLLHCALLKTFLKNQESTNCFANLSDISRDESSCAPQQKMLEPAAWEKVVVVLP